ncbi:MAG: Methyltransferase type 11, partial [Candidatus Berkelbacteria bacterium]|nr:Methyltransferase type 11 [Candidatus Berkelbacteria bacterium]
MLNFPPEYYEKRLRKIGFTGKDRTLLDAGCGAGHWSLAASNLVKSVSGIDSTEKYLLVAKDIQKGFSKKNIDLIFGKMEKLPYKDNSFDLVFSYCAWMYTKRPKSLKELTRVLKPDGKIYFGAVTGFGWYLKMIGQGIFQGNRQLIWESLKAIKNRVYTNESETRKLFRRNNLRIIGLGSDANLGDPKIIIKPLYE